MNITCHQNIMFTQSIKTACSDGSWISPTEHYLLKYLFINMIETCWCGGEHEGATFFFDLSCVLEFKACCGGKKDEMHGAGGTCEL